MARLIRGMFYIVFTVFGGLCGYSIAVHTAKFYQTLPRAGLITNFAAFILLGVLMGMTLAPVAAALVVRGFDAITVSLQALSLPEVLMGSVGLLFGLIVAFFTNIALQQINFSVIPAIGVYLGPLLIVLSTIFLALLGAFFGSRLVFIHSFRELLEGGGGGRGWGKRLLVIDTSVAVDGRLSHLIETGWLDGVLVVPHFVLHELQMIADSEDQLRRNRGRRGLDVLDRLRQRPGIQIENKDYEERTVDAKLVRLALDLKASLVTTDYNLNKVASLQGVRVLNINELATALKPVVLPGEEMLVRVIREGKESGQGVGYLDDGTMIVVERGRNHVGDTVLAEVTSVVQTSAGKMIFSRFREVAPTLPPPGSKQETNGNGTVAEAAPQPAEHS